VVEWEHTDTEAWLDLPDQEVEALEGREDREGQEDQADVDLSAKEMEVAEVREFDVEEGVIVEQAVEVGETEEGVAGVEDVNLEVEAWTCLLEEGLNLNLDDLFQTEEASVLKYKVVVDFDVVAIVVGWDKVACFAVRSAAN